MFKDANQVGIEIQRRINAIYEKEISVVRNKIEEAIKSTKFEFFISSPISNDIIEELRLAGYTVEICRGQGETNITVKIPRPSYNV